MLAELLLRVACAQFALISKPTTSKSSDGALIYLTLSMFGGGNVYVYVCCAQWSAARTARGVWPVGSILPALLRLEFFHRFPTQGTSYGSATGPRRRRTWPS